MKLTPMFGDYDKAYAKTAPGMAHLAGSGPKGKTCRECIEYQCGKRYKSDGGGHGKGQLMPGKCMQFVKLRQSRKPWPAFPYWMAACRHFVQNPDPPREYDVRAI